VVSVITSISYDHMAILGHTLAEIASEKAGIIKNGRPVVSAPQKEEAGEVIERIAGERNAPLYWVGRDYHVKPIDHNLDEQSFWIWSEKDQAAANEFLSTNGAKGIPPLRLTIPLLGQHQVENAATAYTALMVLRQEGFNISDAALAQGFAQVIWPGRFEILSKQPFLVIDSAHNRDSASRLRQAMEDYFPGREVILVFGASEDKDINGMFSELFPGIQQAVMTQSIHPRAAAAAKLAELAEKFGKPINIIPRIEDALAFALDQVGDKKVILVTGSLFVAAAARAVWPELRPGPAKEIDHEK
jgi:dihydrofolate synthase / folylpolyglutamate synthase